MSVEVPAVAKNSCQDCLILEHELSRASEYFIGLIVQHDQMIRDGNPAAIELEGAMRNARRRRTAAARLLLTHRQSHEAQPKTRTAGETVG